MGQNIISISRQQKEQKTLKLIENRKVQPREKT